MNSTLAKIEDRARRLSEAQEDRDYFVRLAHTEGMSLRKIAEAAGISHEQVRRIVNQ